MKIVLTFVCMLSASISFSQQQSKSDIIKELSSILNKASGINWKSSDVSTTIKSQSATETQVTIVVYKKGYEEGVGSVDKDFINTYTLRWDSLTKRSIEPPKSKKFSLAGCSETGDYCSFQLSFKPNSLKSIEYGTSSDYSSYNTWFNVYVKKEDQDKFFACLQKLYKLLHPGE